MLFRNSALVALTTLSATAIFAHAQCTVREGGGRVDFIGNSGAFRVSRRENAKTRSECRDSSILTHPCHFSLQYFPPDDTDNIDDGEYALIYTQSLLETEVVNGVRLGVESFSNTNFVVYCDMVEGSEPVQDIGFDPDNNLGATPDVSVGAGTGIGVDADVVVDGDVDVIGEVEGGADTDADADADADANVDADADVDVTVPPPTDFPTATPTQTMGPSSDPTLEPGSIQIGGDIDVDTGDSDNDNDTDVDGDVDVDGNVNGEIETETETETEDGQTETADSDGGAEAEAEVDAGVDADVFGGFGGRGLQVIENARDWCADSGVEGASVTMATSVDALGPRNLAIAYCIAAEQSAVVTCSNADGLEEDVDCENRVVYTMDPGSMKFSILVDSWPKRGTDLTLTIGVDVRGDGNDDDDDNDDVSIHW